MKKHRVRNQSAAAKRDWRSELPQEGITLKQAEQQDTGKQCCCKKIADGNLYICNCCRIDGA